MTYRRKASDQEICDQLCPYQIGDKVKLTKKFESDNGFFESGTVLTIMSIHIRQDLKIQAVPFDQLSTFHADVGVFEFELIDIETSIKMNATADYWGESLINKKRMNRLLLQLYTPTICIAVCTVILLLVNRDYVAIACMPLLSVLLFTTSYHITLKSNIKPDLWRLHGR